MYQRFVLKKTYTKFWRIETKYLSRVSIKDTSQMESLVRETSLLYTPYPPLFL